MVLLIDDDMVSREVMATVLTMSGYTVHAAESGLEALSLLDSGACRPEVILMDTQMPGLSGRALIEQLRGRSKATLYAISGSDAPTDVVDGADGFLMKPFGPEALQRVLQRHCIQTEDRGTAVAPILHLETLAQFRAIMPEASVREIYLAVLADLDKRQGALASAIGAGDGAEVMRIGHSIKGGCGMAGAKQASHIGELIECRGDDLEYSQTMLGELKTAAENLRRMLEAEFSPQGIDPAI